MTKQEAIEWLRLEQPGDSIHMKRAKEMGAKALERQQIHFVRPVCENCGQVVEDVVLHTAYEFSDFFDTLYMVRKISPARCPRCGNAFDRVDIDYEAQTITLKGGKT